jgi:hypothetical protein
LVLYRGGDQAKKFRILHAAAVDAVPASASPFQAGFRRWFAIAAGFAGPRRRNGVVIFAQAGDPVFRIGQLEEQVRT